MNLAAFSVKNYQFTLVVFAMMVALGVTSYLAIPKAEDPQFPIPIYPVVAVYPGAGPEDLEELVVRPLEDEISELDDIKTIRSSVDDGVAVVRVEFEAGVDADEKYEEVLRSVNLTRPDLPEGLYSLDVNRVNSANVAIAQLALVSENAPYRILSDEADRLERLVEAVPGVRRAETHAAPEREVRVSVDLDKLAALRLPVGALMGAIQGGNVSVPGGSVELGPRRLNLRTTGTYASLDELGATVVAQNGPAVVRVRDVATVAWGYEDATYTGRYNGRRAVFVTVQQQEGQTIFAVRDGVAEALNTFEQGLPANIKLERGFDQAVNVERRLEQLAEDFGIAILLVLLTLLPLGLRASLVVMISIPLSLAMGVAILDFAGFSINQLSIVGFVIALGLLVDDSIVVVENIERHLREGYSRTEAAIRGTQGIAVAVVGCTAALVFAFLPMLFLPGGAGDYIRSLPAAVIATILASLLVSLTIVPFLASRMLKPHESAEGNVFLRALNRGIHGTYGRVLHVALARPKLTALLALVLFAGSLALVPGIGFSLFPKAGIPQFMIDVRTPEGSSLAETDRATRYVEAALRATPEVRAYFTNVGAGNPQVYYNVQSAGERAHEGALFVQLHTYSPATTPAALDRLRARLAGYPNAKIEVREFENGPPIDAPVAIRLLGDDLDTLRALAARTEAILKATPGTIYVNNPVRLAKTDLEVVIDRDKAGLYGVPVAEAARAVRLGVAGLGAGRFRDADGDEYPIQVRLPGAGKPTADALGRIYVTGASGAQVPLRQISHVGFYGHPPTIERYNKERAVTVTAFVRTGYNTDEVTTAALAKMDALAFPAGTRYVAAGEIESRQESFGGLGTAIIVAVFTILAILVLEFRTFKSTLIVASVIPLGLVGGLVALALTGYTLSFTSIIGFVALIGIEIKTSILLVDYTNALRSEGMETRAAIERAGEVRFVPIVLTTLTALGGLLPLALQNSSLYSPIAVVIIGGLVSSTVLARLVTPVMYRLLTPEVEMKPAPSA